MSSPRKPSRPARARAPQKRPGVSPKASDARRAPRRQDKPAPAPVEAPRTGVFRVGYVLGATFGSWVTVWRERFPFVTLELVPIAGSDALTALLSQQIDIAITREPVVRDDLHVISLYEEIVGVVASVDSVLESADDLRCADLNGEVVIVARDDVLNRAPIDGTQAPRFAPPLTTRDAVETVASGVGVVVVPMSISRLYKRKDVRFHPLVDAKPTQVVLAWNRDNDSADIQAFVAIVRGRTARTSRS